MFSHTTGLKISVTYIMFCGHSTGEEEVRDGCEEQAAGGDEHAHPPGPDPSGISRPQLLFSSCTKQQWTQRWTIFPVVTWLVNNFGMPFNHYLNQFCPRPRRSAAWLSPAGIQWLARIQIQKTGWLWTIKRLLVAEISLSCFVIFLSNHELTIIRFFFLSMLNLLKTLKILTL